MAEIIEESPSAWCAGLSPQARKIIAANNSAEPWCEIDGPQSGVQANGCIIRQQRHLNSYTLPSGNKVFEIVATICSSGHHLFLFLVLEDNQGKIIPESCWSADEIAEFVRLNGE